MSESNESSSSDGLLTANPVTDNSVKNDTTPNGTSWWSRAGGGKEVFAIAIPLVISSLSWTVLTFVDRMLLNHWSGAAMAASFMASNAWFAIVCLPLGVCSYTGTFVAQYHGSKQPDRIGPSVWQGVWFAVAVSPLILLTIPFADGIFGLAGHSAESTALEVEYYKILTFGSPAMLIGQALACFYSGRGKTVVVMIVDAFFALVNLVLDYWWIFGLTLGETEIFPAMGIAGAGWATVVSLWGKALVYLLMVLRKENRLRFATNKPSVERELFHRIMKFGGPSGLQMLLDVIGFTIFLLLVGRLGAVETEATSMTFSIGSLAFMPIVGFGIAVSILVGQHLGENRDHIAAQATWTSMHIAWGYMLIASIVLVFFPEILLAGFFAGETVIASAQPLSDIEYAAHQEAVRSKAIVLMRFVAGYNFLDAMLIVFASAIKGAGDTRFVLKVSLTMSILLATLSWLAVEHWGAGLVGCWCIIASWIGGMGILYFFRFIGGKWRTMRVIEPVAE